MSTIDLHMHSHISLDGEYSPAQLTELCREAGLKTIALTDHNSVRDVEEMAAEGTKYGLDVIPAIELDCTLWGTDLHLLGYGIDVTDSRYAEYEQDILARKRLVSAEQMHALKELGILFEEAGVSKLAREGIVVAEMIAEVAIADIRNKNNPVMQPYLPGGTRSDNPYVNFFWDFCSQGKAAFKPVSYMPFEKAAELILSTGGIPVIAHPVNTVKKNEDMIAFMVQSGVRGIEVFSSYHTVEDILYYKKIAQKLHVLQTMGSDFHGKSKPSVCLGKTGGDGMEEELLEGLQAYIL